MVFYKMYITFGLTVITNDKILFILFLGDLSDFLLSFIVLAGRRL